jgi:hypothetical protein
MSGQVQSDLCLGRLTMVIIVEEPNLVYPCRGEDTGEGGIGISEFAIIAAC